MCLRIKNDIIYKISEKMIVYKHIGNVEGNKYRTGMRNFLYEKNKLQPIEELLVINGFVSKGYHFYLDSISKLRFFKYRTGVFELPKETRIIYGDWFSKGEIVANQCIYLGTLRQYQRQQFINKWINKIKNLFK